MIDVIFIAVYLTMIMITRLAIAPALAFFLTVFITTLDFNGVIQQTLFIATYTACSLFALPKIGYTMLASAVINFISVVYFLFDLYLQNYETYFLTCMIIVNIIILYSIIEGVKNGSDDPDSASVFSRIFDFFNLQIHSKTGQRR